MLGEASGFPYLVINGRAVVSPVDDLDEELTDVTIGYLSFYTGVPADDFGGRLDR